METIHKLAIVVVALFTLAFGFGILRGNMKMMEESIVEPFGELTIAEAEKIVKDGFISPIAEDTTLIAEGLVLRPKVQLFNKRGERIMVKIKYRDYPHENC